MLQERALVHLTHARFDEALADLAQAELEPEFVASSSHAFHRGYALRCLGRHHESIAAMTRAIELDPSNLNARSSRASSHFALQLFEAAIDDYSSAIELATAALPELASTAATLYNNRGLARAYAAHALSSTLADFSEAIRLAPTNASFLNNRGSALLNHRRFLEAEQDFSRAIALIDSSATVRLNRGNALVALGRHGDAIHDFDAAIRLDPTLVSAFLARAHAYQHLDLHESAIDDFTHVLCQCSATTNTSNSKNATVIAALNGRGVSKGSLGQHQAALRDLCEALRLDSTDALLLNNRGLVYHALECFGEAIEDFSSAIYKSKEPPIKAFLNRAAAYASLQRYADAANDLSEVLYLEPANLEALYNRALANAALELHQDAVADLTQLLHHVPYDQPERLVANQLALVVSALHARSISYSRLGKQQEASVDTAAATNLEPMLSITPSPRAPVATATATATATPTAAEVSNGTSNTSTEHSSGII